MIWYLLYPFRGTSRPPRLPSENPIRRAFYRHGALTARYWLLVMLFTVSTGVLAVYPTVFLPDFPAGMSSPHHVWTGSISFEARTEKQPDLEMRQIWLQGSYMAALNTSMLEELFTLRDLLLPTSLAEHSGSWDIHSATSYWKDSKDLLLSDTDPVRTLNQHSTDQDLSLLGLAIQPLSTMAGRTVRNGQVVAADALVMTLLNTQNDSIGHSWQSALSQLGTTAPPHWQIRATEDRADDHGIYEYKYQPFSFRQSWALTGAYLGMVIYVAISLRRLKAFKSRAGLVVTAVTQMTTSILASFTICGLLRINLAQVPQEAYPFVVLSIGLENIFRLINAVLAYPAEMTNIQRIAGGVGDVGHAAFVSVAQNLAILWLLSLFVSPGVAAFCAFAAIAIIFDWYYLMSFYVAVLNVDIRRLELQDALVKPRAPSRRRKSPGRRSWIDAVIHGGLPASTRMAGSVVTITFVMALNWHLSDHNITSSLRTSPWSTPSTKQYLPLSGTAEPTVPAPTSNRTSSWYGSSLSTSSSQFMHIIAPRARSFTARIYDPLVITVGDADRTGVPALEETWLFYLREIAITHFYPSSLAVVFMIAFVTVLMNFLLWDERAEKEEIEMNGFDDSPLSCKTVDTTHKLDIVCLAESKSGAMLSGDLHRSLSLTVPRDRAMQAFSSKNIRTFQAVGGSRDEAASTKSLNIHDESSRFAAFCQDGSILNGSFEVNADPLSVPLDVGTQPVLLDFVAKPSADMDTQLSFLVLEADGTVHEVDQESSEQTRTRLPGSKATIRSALALADDSGHSQLLLLTQHQQLLSFSWVPQAQLWMSLESELSTMPQSQQHGASHDCWLYNVPSLQLFLLCSKTKISFMDRASLQVIFSINVASCKLGSVRVMHSDPSRCSACDGVACLHFSLVYTDASNGDLVLLSSTEEAAEPLICFSGRSGSCTLLSDTPSFESRLPSPGQWEATSLLCIAGVRRTSRGHLDDDAELDGSASSPLLRRRRRASNTLTFRRAKSEAGPEWEAYLFTHAGSYHSLPVKDHLPSNPASANDLDAPSTQLYATALGPVARLAPDTVGVALGNSVVVVRVNRNPDGEGIALQQGRGRSSMDGMLGREQLRRVGSRRGRVGSTFAMGGGREGLAMSRAAGKRE